MTTIYLSDREVGIQWNDRGAIHMVDRQGNQSERFTPPHDSIVLFSNEITDVVPRWVYSDTWG